MTRTVVSITPGSGEDVAVDDIGGVNYQLVKLAHGKENVAADVTVDDPLPVADTAAGNVLLRILQMLMAPLGYDKAQGRQRATVIVESGTVTTVSTVNTVTTVTTVSSVANVAAVGGYSAQMQIFDANRAAWALGVRSRIT